MYVAIRSERADEINYLVSRLEAALKRSRPMRERVDLRVRLHETWCVAIETLTEVIRSADRPPAFDVTDGLGELVEGVLGAIRLEYERDFDGTGSDELTQTLVLATAGLLLRAYQGLLGRNLDVEVDKHLSMILRTAA